MFHKNIKIIIGSMIDVDLSSRYAYKINVLNGIVYDGSTLPKIVKIIIGNQFDPKYFFALLI